MQVNIEPAKYKETRKKKGDTVDIIEEVINCYTDTHQQVAAFAPNLQGSSLTHTCSNIWHFIKNNIKYQIDPVGIQWVRTPARTWADRLEGSDCKSFSVLAASLCKQLGITPTFRFTSYSLLFPTPTHVYVVVKQGKKEIIIDAVIEQFNTQKPYSHKQDYTMTSISRLSGPTQNPATAAQRKAALLADRLVIERNNEVQANGGYILETRANSYSNNIAQQLNKAGLNSVGSTAIAGGFFGSLLGINAKLQKELTENLANIAPAFLYLFIGQDLVPNESYGVGTFNGEEPTQNSPLYYARTALEKRRKAAQCFWDIRGQIDDLSGEELMQLIANGITEVIGMTPKAYWTNFFSKSNNIDGVNDDDDYSWYDEDPSTDAPTTTGKPAGFNWGGLFGQGGGDKGAALDVAGAALGIPPGILSGAYNSLLPSLQFRPALETFTPNVKTDFKNTPYAGNSVPNPKALNNSNNANEGGVTASLDNKKLTNTLLVGGGALLAAKLFKVI